MTKSQSRGSCSAVRSHERAHFAPLVRLDSRFDRIRQSHLLASLVADVAPEELPELSKSRVSRSEMLLHSCGW